MRTKIGRHLSGHSKWKDFDDDDEVFIQNFPKVELHVHLDGSFDPEFLWQYMQKNPESIYCLPVKSSPPWEENDLMIRSMVQECETSNDFHKLCTCRGHRSLKQMLNCFEIFLPLVRGNLELIEQLSFDFCKRQWEQNVVYTEVRYSPHLWTEGVSVETSESSVAEDDTVLRETAEAVVEAVTEGLRRGCTRYNIVVNQILCCICWRPDWAADTLDLAIKYRKNFPCAIVGIDVAAGEEHFDAENHADLFGPHFDMAKSAIEHNIPLTLHAGEATDHALENIRRAVTDYGACRIGHGYRMIESPQILQLVKSSNVHVEVCPTSSVETGGWVLDDQAEGKNWERHPIKAMIENGLAVSLSSDDPAVFHTSLSWQYRVALAKMGLTRQDLSNMNVAAIEAAFCSDEEKALLLNRVQSYPNDRDVSAGVETDQRKSHDMFKDRVYLKTREYV